MTINKRYSLMYEVRTIQAKQAYPLRSSVLRPNQDISSCIFKGDKSSSTIHLGVFLKNEIVAIGSFMPSSKNEVQIRGMATHSNFLEKGLASKLLIYGEEVFKRQGFQKSWCNARKTAQGFYLKNNYHIVGEYFEIPNIGQHIVMKKNL